MPIRIVIEKTSSGERYCPHVFCDHCGEDIEIASNGNYEYLVDEHGYPITGELAYTHKHCCYAFEGEHGGTPVWFTGELSDLPIFLENNLKIDRKAVIKRLTEFGL